MILSAKKRDRLLFISASSIKIITSLSYHALRVFKSSSVGAVTCCSFRDVQIYLHFYAILLLWFTHSAVCLLAAVHTHKKAVSWGGCLCVEPRHSICVQLHGRSMFVSRYCWAFISDGIGFLRLTSPLLRANIFYFPSFSQPHLFYSRCWAAKID